MTIKDANALLKAFLAAKAAGQEELWRETHPAAPDGPTVLVLWLIKNGCSYRTIVFNGALQAIDTRCALRMAIYAAIAAQPKWVEYCSAKTVKRSDAPLAAIRAAIACYRDPTDETRRAAREAANAAWYAADAAYKDKAITAAGAAFAAANADAAGYAAHAAAAAMAIDNANSALGYTAREKVSAAVIAAIADHYEGRPLEMP